MTDEAPEQKVRGRRRTARGPLYVALPVLECPHCGRVWSPQRVVERRECPACQRAVDVRVALPTLLCLFCSATRIPRTGVVENRCRTCRRRGGMIPQSESLNAFDARSLESGASSIQGAVLSAATTNWTMAPVP